MKKYSALCRWSVLLFLVLSALPLNGLAETNEGSAGDDRKVQREPGKAKMTEKGLFTVSVSSEGGELMVGMNKLGLVILDRRDRKVEGAEIVVTPWMPSGGHGVWEKPVVTPRGSGNYRVDNVVLVRSGYWDLKIAIKKGADEDRTTFSFPVGLSGAANREDFGKPKGTYRRTLEYYKVPDVTLLNQDGEKVKLRSYLDSGKPVIIDFIYTTCTTICPILSAGFSSLRDELGKEAGEVQLISLSIDPDRDRPDRMKAYLGRFNADKGWDFLTGTRQDITLVLKAFNAYIPDKMQHEPLYLLHNSAKSDVWVRVNGLIGTFDLLREYRMMKGK